MKKTIAILMALVLAVGLTACGEKKATDIEDVKKDVEQSETEAEEVSTDLDENPYSIYTAMNTTLDKPTSIDMEMDMTMVMSDGVDTVKVDSSSNIQTIYKSPTDIDMKMNISANSNGETSESIAYYTNGVMYQEVEGAKISIDVPIEDMEDVSNTSGMEMFNEESVKESAANKVGENIELTFIIDKAVVNEITKGSLESMFTSMGLDPSQVNITYSDLEYTALLSEKTSEPVKQQMKFDATISMDGESIDVKYTIDIKYNSINNVEAIDFPDFSEYQSMEDYMAEMMGSVTAEAEQAA